MKKVSSILTTKATKELDEQAKKEAAEAEDKSIASVLKENKNARENSTDKRRTSDNDRQDSKKISQEV